MNSKTIKKLVGSTALLGVVLSASAGPLPSGTSPAAGAPLPAGLNPNIDLLAQGNSFMYALPNGGSPVAVGQELFASGGPVYVTQLGPTGAGFDEQLFVASPNDGMNGLFLDNHSTPNGTTFYLGTFAAATEIEFGLDMLDTDGSQVETNGTILYDGPGSRNPDGDVHAYMVNNFEGLADTTYVGFEDEIADVPSDFNYIDEVYAFTGTTSAATPDASSTLPLLSLGLTALAGVARRFRK
jgi:hypothetical protein